MVPVRGSSSHVACFAEITGYSLACKRHLNYRMLHRATQNTDVLQNTQSDFTWEQNSNLNRLFIFIDTFRFICCIFKFVLFHFHFIFQDKIPLRVKAVHVVNQPFYFNAIYAVFRPFLKKKLRKRVSMIPVSLYLLTEVWKMIFSRKCRICYFSLLSFWRQMGLIFIL